MSSSPAGLGWLESLWTELYRDRNPMLVTTVFSVVLHELVYFGRYLPFLLCDHIPFLRQYKIQNTKENTPELLWKCVRSLMFSHFCVQLPMQMFFHPVAELFGMKITETPFPSWYMEFLYLWYMEPQPTPDPHRTTMAYQIVLFLFFEDCYQYWFHRLLHYGPFYKHIHKWHHEFSAPFGITAEYAHPAETLILGIGTIGGPLVYVFATGDLHIITVYAWLIVRLFQTVDAHSGYDFPWSLHHFVPFWAGADFHDHHHMVFLGNYSSSFRFWDWICGTDKRYNLWKERQQQVEKRKGTVAGESALDPPVALKEE